MKDTFIFSALAVAALLGFHPVQAAEPNTLSQSVAESVAESVTETVTTAETANETLKGSVLEFRETIIHSTKTLMSVDLNKNTVLCSAADYSMPMLKVLIPGLSNITLLDHQNSGAGAPCVTTGESCRGFANESGATPFDILQGRPGVEPIEVTVTEKRIDAINHKDKTCQVQLVETVETNIRGKTLFHERRTQLEPRSFHRCINGGL